MQPEDAWAQESWDALSKSLGEAESLLRLMEIYITDSTQAQAVMHEAFQQGDRKRVIREAHDMKSNAGMLGFGWLSEVCKDLERESLRLSNEELQMRLEIMDDMLSEAREQCRKYLARNKKP